MPNRTIQLSGHKCSCHGHNFYRETAQPLFVQPQTLYEAKSFRILFLASYSHHFARCILPQKKKAVRESFTLFLPAPSVASLTVGQHHFQMKQKSICERIETMFGMRFLNGRVCLTKINNKKKNIAKNEMHCTLKLGSYKQSKTDDHEDDTRYTQTVHSVC